MLRGANGPQRTRRLRYFPPTRLSVSRGAKLQPDSLIRSQDFTETRNLFSDQQLVGANIWLPSFETLVHPPFLSSVPNRRNISLSPHRPTAVTISQPRDPDHPGSI